MDKVNYVIYLLFNRFHSKRLSQDIKTLACNPLILLLFVTQLHNISDNELCQLYFTISMIIFYKKDFLSIYKKTKYML